MNSKILFLLIIILPFHSYAQKDKNKDSVEWASPSVEGMNLGKGIVFSYRRLSPYNIISESQVSEVGSDSGEIQRIRNLEFKIRLPVLLKSQTQVVVGLEYNTDEFEFEHPQNIDYPFYSQLHHKALRGRGLKFYFNHSISDRKYVFSRASIELNGDIPDEWHSALRYTLAATYGWKLSPYKAWGVGFYFSYNFGRPLLLPALVYNVTWNSRWGLESLFPGMVMIRYQPNSNNIFYIGYDVQGASYNMDFGSALNQRFHNIQLRRSELTPVIIYEKELYDFIWMSVRFGYRINLNFNISEDTYFEEKEIIVNDVNSGTFVGGSVFIIPTESLKKLIKKKN